MKHPGSTSSSNFLQEAKEGTNSSSTRDRLSSSASAEEEMAALAEEEMATDAGSSRVGRRGQSTRHRYTLTFKKTVLTTVDDLKEKLVRGPVMKAAEGYHSLVAKWAKPAHRQNLDIALKSTRSTDATQRQQQANSKAAKKTHLHQGAKAKYSTQEARVHELLKEARQKGKKVSERWIKVTMKKELRNTVGATAAEEFRASKGWFNSFLSRHKLSLRVKTNNKASSIEERLPKIKRWHARLRRHLLKGKRVDAKWGRWLPHNRFNVDQVPLTLQDGNVRTYEDVGAKRVWVRASKRGDDKREATLQLCACLDNSVEVEQPYPVVIFRGKGKRISQREKEAWDDRVRVAFQPKAWADGKFCQWYAEECFPDFVEPEEKNLVFLDNLSGQTLPEVVAAYKDCNTKVHFLPADCTDLIQPVDAGIGLRTKALVKEQHEKWLEDDDNLNQWVEGKVQAWQRRVLITKWLGDAWEEVVRTVDFKEIGVRTGCLMTGDGSDDDLIHPQGTTNYTFAAADAGSEHENSESSDLGDTDGEEGFDLEICTDSESDIDACDDEAQADDES